MSTVFKDKKKAMR